MVEGAVSSHRPALSLEQHGLAGTSDPPVEGLFLVGQCAAWGIVPELEEPTVNFSDSIKKLEPYVAGETVTPKCRRVDV